MLRESGDLQNGSFDQQQSALSKLQFAHILRYRLSLPWPRFFSNCCSSLYSRFAVNGRPLNIITQYGTLSPLILSPAEEEKVCRALRRLEQPTHNRRRGGESCACISISIISMGSSRWRISMARSSSHIDDSGPVSLGCQSVGLFR